MLHEHHFRAMNTDVGIWLWANPPQVAAEAARLCRQSERRVADIEGELSRFRTTSGLSRLNDAAGDGPQPVSPLLFTLLTLSLAASRASDGIFDPTLLRSLEQAGYDRSFEQLEPDRESVTGSCVFRPGAWRRLTLDAACRTVTLPAGVGIDLGGIAKGRVVDTVVSQLRAFGPVLVDAGGDLRVSGPVGDERWPIAVQDPFLPDLDRGVVRLASGAMATSGIGGRRWKTSGNWRHHLLDSRTGEPADSDLHTVTVQAPDALTADVAAKVALVLGSEAGAGWLRTSGLTGLLTRRDGTEVAVGDFWGENVND